jgi:hypothetical protein
MYEALNVHEFTIMFICTYIHTYIYIYIYIYLSCTYIKICGTHMINVYIYMCVGPPEALSESALILIF